MIRRLHLTRRDPVVVLAGGVFRARDASFEARIAAGVHAVAPRRRSGGSTRRPCSGPRSWGSTGCRADRRASGPRPSGGCARTLRPRSSARPDPAATATNVGHGRDACPWHGPAAGAMLSVMQRPGSGPDSLWSPARRGLTIGLVLTITLVAFEALAISTVLPIVARDLGDLEHYGWVFTSFFLGSLIGIAVVGGVINRGGLGRPLAIGLGLFAIGLLLGGLAMSMPMLIGARFIQGLGAGTIPPIAYVAIGRSLPESLRPRMFAVLSTAWVLPGVIGPAIAGVVGETLGWRTSSSGCCRSSRSPAS